MSEKTWNINGKHFKFDFGDLECANRYDAACREMKRRSETVPEFESRQDLIRYYCESFFAFYDDIFGAGTADQIFNGRYNMDPGDRAMVHELYLQRQPVEKVAYDHAYSRSGLYRRVHKAMKEVYKAQE